LRIDYYEPSVTLINPIIFKLSEGDISKIEIIENLDVKLCYEWYYLIRVKELNEMRLRIAEWNKIKSK